MRQMFHSYSNILNILLLTLILITFDLTIQLNVLFMSSKGFGNIKSSSMDNNRKETITNGFGSKSQIKSIQSNSLCLCNSKLTYKDCCELLHKDYSLDIDPVQMTRARYSAYALGLPDYILQTSHYTNKDYLRHYNSNKDPRQAFKSWKKEIITKNSEVFDFLKFELITNITDNTGNDQYKDQLSEQLVCYYVIAREKRTSKVIAFKESALYAKDLKSKHKIALTNSNDNIDTMNMNPSQWYYINGTVTPMEENILESFLKDLPKYNTQDTIRDRW